MKAFPQSHSGEITPDTPEEYSELQRRFITDQFTAMNNAIGNCSDNLWAYIVFVDGVEKSGIRCAHKPFPCAEQAIVERFVGAHAGNPCVAEWVMVVEIAVGRVVELDNYDEDGQIVLEEQSCAGSDHYIDALRITPDTPEEYSELQRRFIHVLPNGSWS